MNSFKQLLLSSEVDQSFKDKPKVCNESGTSWVIGYNHMICDDYEYLQFQGGINESRADELLEEDLKSYLIVLEKEFNEMKVKQKFCELNTGCQYLLLSIFFSTGRFSQYSKLVDLCSKNQLYEALKYNNRKSLFNQELERDLQQYTNKERQFFEEHFLSDGTPKNKNEWKKMILNLLIVQFNVDLRIASRKLSMQNSITFSNAIIKVLTLSNLQEIKKEKNIISLANRIFLKFGKINLNVVDDKLEKFHSLTIEQIKMVVDAREQVEGGEEILIEDPNNAASIFVNQFIKAYDQISQKYPVFKRLKEVLMANYLAKYMSSKNVQLNFEVIDQLFTSYLIPNYKKYECPTLQMNVEVSDGMIEISGGIEGGVQDIQRQIQKINDYLTQNKEINDPLKITNENQQITEVSLSHSSSVDSLQSAITTFSMNPIAKQKVNSKSKSKQKCSKCQQFAKENEQLKVFQEKPVCKSCQKCTQCGRSDAGLLEGSNFYHPYCVKLINQSNLKNELLSLIQNKLNTTERKGNLNGQNQYFIYQKFECLKLQNYSGFIYGYHHVKYKNPKVQVDFKTFRLDKEKAQEYLSKEFEQAESDVIKQFIQQGHQDINAIPENLKLLLAFANFILRDLTRLKSQFIVPDYKNLHRDLQNLKCTNSVKHTCTLKSKIAVGLQFFDKYFQNEDGKQKKSYLQKQPIQK